MENVNLAGVTATKTARNKVKHSQGLVSSYFFSMSNYIVMQVRSLDTAVHVIFVFLLYALATTNRIPSANKF